MRVISGIARGTILHSIEDENTRPTLDRVKESIFNIIKDKISDSIILDLFAGSGAIGIEFISRNAEKVYFVDTNKKAVDMINKNLEKTRFKDKSEVLNLDYVAALKKLKNNKFDFIYLDPPYKRDFGINSINMINEYGLLAEDGIIIFETDDKKNEEEILKMQNSKEFYLKIYDKRKYGRAQILFLNKKPLERGKV